MFLQTSHARLMDCCLEITFPKLEAVIRAGETTAPTGNECSKGRTWLRWRHVAGNDLGQAHAEMLHGAGSLHPGGRGIQYVIA